MPFSKGMRLALCLLILAAAGVALLVLPDPVFRLPTETYPAFYDLWRKSLIGFGIPVVLMGLGLTRSVVVKLVDLAWGLWMTILSAWVSIALKELAPSATSMGNLFVMAIFVVSLGVVVFSCMSLTTKPKAKGKDKPKKKEPAEEAPPPPLAANG